jgi:hypothetical protein
LQSVHRSPDTPPQTVPVVRIADTKKSRAVGAHRGARLDRRKPELHARGLGCPGSSGLDWIVLYQNRMGPIVDIFFGVRGSRISADHGYVLYGEVARVLETREDAWLHQLNQVGLHLIRGVYGPRQFQRMVRGDKTIQALRHEWVSLDILLRYPEARSLAVSDQ